MANLSYEGIVDRIGMAYVTYNSAQVIYAIKVTDQQAVEFLVPDEWQVYVALIKAGDHVSIRFTSGKGRLWQLDHVMASALGPKSQFLASFAAP